MINQMLLKEYRYAVIIRCGYNKVCVCVCVCVCVQCSGMVLASCRELLENCAGVLLMAGQGPCSKGAVRRCEKGLGFQQHRHALRHCLELVL